MKTAKLYDSVRHPETASNIAVVGKLTIFVHEIARDEVLFVLNPNIDGFHESKRTGTQRVSFQATDETLLSRLTPSSPPIRVEAVGERYEVCIAGIGTEWFLSIAFSPDGHRIATGRSDGIVQISDATNGRQLLGLQITNYDTSKVVTQGWNGEQPLHFHDRPQGRPQIRPKPVKRSLSLKRFCLTIGVRFPPESTRSDID